MEIDQIAFSQTNSVGFALFAVVAVAVKSFGRGVGGVSA